MSEFENAKSNFNITNAVFKVGKKLDGQDLDQLKVIENEMNNISSEARSELKRTLSDTLKRGFTINDIEDMQAFNRVYQLAFGNFNGEKFIFNATESGNKLLKDVKNSNGGYGFSIIVDSGKISIYGTKRSRIGLISNDGIFTPNTSYITDVSGNNNDFYHNNGSSNYPLISGEKLKSYNGKATLISQSGDVTFQGTVSNGVPKSGRLLTANGDIFDGSFDKNGDYNEGTIYSVNGETKISNGRFNIEVAGGKTESRPIKDFSYYINPLNFFFPAANAQGINLDDIELDKDLNPIIREPTQEPPKPTQEPPKPTQEPPKSTQEPPKPTQEPPKPTPTPPKPTQEPPKPEPKPKKEVPAPKSLEQKLNEAFTYNNSRFKGDNKELIENVFGIKLNLKDDIQKIMDFQRINKLKPIDGKIGFNTLKKKQELDGSTGILSGYNIVKVSNGSFSIEKKVAESSKEIKPVDTGYQIKESFMSTLPSNIDFSIPKFELKNYKAEDLDFSEKVIFSQEETEKSERKIKNLLEKLVKRFMERRVSKNYLTEIINKIDEVKGPYSLDTIFIDVSAKRLSKTGFDKDFINKLEKSTNKDAEDDSVKVSLSKLQEGLAKIN